MDHVKVVTADDYKIMVNSVRSYLKGTEIYRGKPKKVYGIQEIYVTNVGKFEPEKWRDKIREIIDLSGENALLEQIMQYCRERCAWLHKESDIEEYSMDCLASRVYRHWKDFEFTESPERKIFIFEEV